MDGIINVLKPTGMTSHDVVGFIRKNFNIKKVGHTGTLDPNAAGVLPICIGKATKAIQYMDLDMKSYIGEVLFGTKTDTQDKYGKILDVSHNTVSEEEINTTFNRYKGEIYQIPPQYSAIKIKGKKLYEYARQGKTVDVEPRKRHIYELNILNNIQNKRVLFDVMCSQGTYIRTLCNDIGADLGVYGHMTFLLRTKVGKFSIEDTFTIEEMKETIEKNDIKKLLTPIDNALDNLTEIYLDDMLYNKIINGASVKIRNEKYYKKDSKVRVYCKNRFIGIGIINKIVNTYLELKMEKVFI